MTNRAAAPQVRVTDRHFVLSGLATAHSHAFQRALRGRTQRRATAADSFWSWRGLMYHLAEGLNPERIYALSHFAYVELAMSGVTAVGEFHYVHHAPDGRPYADRVAMAEAVIRAAKDAGIRITLIRTALKYGAEAASREMIGIIEDHVGAMDRKIARLQQLRDDLTDVADAIQTCLTCDEARFPAPCRRCEVMNESRLRRTLRALWSD